MYRMPLAAGLLLVCLTGCRLKVPGTATSEDGANGAPGASVPASGEFDPKSAMETVKWLAIESDRIRKHEDKGNTFANKTKAQVIADVCKVPVGQSIEWRLVAKRINANRTVHVGETTWPETVEPKSEAHVTYLRLYQRSKNKNDGSVLPWGGSDDALRALRPGDPVRVTGQVVGVHREDWPVIVRENPQPPHQWRPQTVWQFILDDAQVLPAR